MTSDWSSSEEKCDTSQQSVVIQLIALTACGTNINWKVE